MKTAYVFPQRSKGKTNKLYKLTKHFCSHMIMQTNYESSVVGTFQLRLLLIECVP